MQILLQFLRFFSFQDIKKATFQYCMAHKRVSLPTVIVILESSCQETAVQTLMIRGRTEESSPCAVFLTLTCVCMLMATELRMWLNEAWAQRQDPLIAPRSTAFMWLDVDLQTVCVFAVKKAVFLHQIAAVEIKQLVLAVIFRGLSPKSRLWSDVSNHSFKKKKKKVITA